MCGVEESKEPKKPGTCSLLLLTTSNREEPAVQTSEHHNRG